MASLLEVAVSDLGSSLDDLLHLLDLEPLEVNLFRGQSRDLGGKAVFGGQVIGQALVAASRTVEDRLPHSLHAYFLRPGDMAHPIVYEVDRVRDGKRFTARRVQAIQGGEVLLSLICSFQVPEEGLEHQAQMPDVAPPESLRPQREVVAEWLGSVPSVPPRIREAFERRVAVEFRRLEPRNPLLPTVEPPRQAFWVRANGKLPDAPLVHACVLAYASDFSLLSTALLPHGVSWLTPGLAVASIDHALWFHRTFRVDEWLLYVMDSPSAQGGRGLSRGQFFDRGGRLVASVAQENLMRRIGG
ncbi:MAG: acyl-CoA thioesterase [Myxococcaceae bacterium]